MPDKGLPDENEDRIEVLEKRASDIEASIAKMTDILLSLNTQVKEDLITLKTKVGAIPSDNLKDDVKNIKETVDKIPVIGDIDSSLNSLVVTKLNDANDGIKEIPKEINLDSFRSELNKFYDKVKQSNNETKDNLRSHIDWNREKINGHVNWRVDRLRKEDFRKLVELLNYAFQFSFSDSDVWSKHRAEKFNEALRDYYK